MSIKHLYLLCHLDILEELMWQGQRSIRNNDPLQFFLLYLNEQNKVGIAYKMKKWNLCVHEHSKQVKRWVISVDRVDYHVNTVTLAYLHVIMMDKSYFFRKRLNNLTEHLLRRKGYWKLNPGAWEDPRNLNPELLTNEIFLATVFSFQHHIPSNIGKMGWFMALVKCSEYSHGDNPC